MNDLPRWVEIPGYDGRYLVSDDGRVWSNISNRELNHSLNGPGYVHVRLAHPDGKPRAARVHRLVIESFTGQSGTGLLVLHENDIRTDNRLENLRFGTYSDNARDRVKNGHDHNSNKTVCLRGHELTSDNTYTDKKNCRSCIKCRRLAKKKGD